MPRISASGGGGDPEAAARALGARIEGDAARLLATRDEPDPGVDPAGVEVPPSTIPAAVRAVIENVVGAENLTVAAAERVQHTRGFSTPDLLRLRAGDVTDAPDAVAPYRRMEQVLAAIGYQVLGATWNPRVRGQGEVMARAREALSGLTIHPVTRHRSADEITADLRRVQTILAEA